MSGRIVSTEIGSAAGRGVADLPDVEAIGKLATVGEGLRVIGEQAVVPGAGVVEQ